MSYFVIVISEFKYRTLLARNSIIVLINYFLKSQIWKLYFKMKNALIFALLLSPLCDCKMYLAQIGDIGELSRNSSLKSAQFSVVPGLNVSLLLFTFKSFL